MNSEEYSPKTLPLRSTARQNSPRETQPDSPLTPRAFRPGGHSTLIQWESLPTGQVDSAPKSLSSLEGSSGRLTPDFDKALPPVPLSAQEELWSSNSNKSSRSSVLGSLASGSTINSVARRLLRVPNAWKVNALNTARSFAESSGGEADVHDSSEIVTQARLPTLRGVEATRPSSWRASSAPALTLRPARSRQHRGGIVYSDEGDFSSTVGTAAQDSPSKDTSAANMRDLHVRPSIPRFRTDPSKSLLRHLRSFTEPKPKLTNSPSQAVELSEQPEDIRLHNEADEPRLHTPLSESDHRAQRHVKKTTLLPSSNLPSPMSTVSSPFTQNRRPQSKSKQYFQRRFGRKRSSAADPDTRTLEKRSPTSPTQKMLESVTVFLESSGSSKGPLKQPSTGTGTPRLSKSNSVKSLLTSGSKTSGSGRSAIPSISNSLRRLMMGKSPLNTPMPQDTYKGSDSNDYFKVEMTHTNGPNFLPSEATRLSTPPLPGERPRRNDRRGFFFDYNPGEEVHSPREIEKEGSGSPRWQGTTRTCDEHDYFSIRIEMIMNEPEAEQFDLNVPEHLPSSPLCPLNPRHKSGGKGICVYHGRGQRAQA